MTNTRLSKGFPKEGKSLTDLGLPNDIDHIDAAFRWSYNGMTFLIAGDMYWKYNEAHMKVHRDYPRDMSMWSGVPVPVDAAFAYKGKNTILNIHFIHYCLIFIIFYHTYELL